MASGDALKQIDIGVGVKVTVVLVFVLIPIVARTSTTYLLLGKITRKIYVGRFLVVVQYFPLTKLSPW